MAIWQYTIYLIPELKLKDTFSDIPNILDKEIWNETDWWKDNLLPSKYEADLSSYSFSKSESWSVDIDIWKKLDETEISVLIDKKEVQEVSVRFDLRSVTKETFEQICLFAQKCKSKMLLENQQVIEPNTELLLKEIKQSEAVSYLKNPQNYFENQIVMN